MSETPAVAELVTLDGGTDARPQRALLWRFVQPHRAISSATIVDGISGLDWIANVEAIKNDSSSDPDEQPAEIATALALAGAGVVLLADDVGNLTQSESQGVCAEATLDVGGINVVIQMPVAFSAGAAISAVVTAAEAKTQALIEAGVPEAASSTDTIVIAWPADSPTERHGGARSEWGARVARVTTAVVTAGIEAAIRS